MIRSWYAHVCHDEQIMQTNIIMLVICIMLLILSFSWNCFSCTASQAGNPFISWPHRDKGLSCEETKIRYDDLMLIFRFDNQSEDCIQNQGHRQRADVWIYVISHSTISEAIYFRQRLWQASEFSNLNCLFHTNCTLLKITHFTCVCVCVCVPDEQLPSATSWSCQERHYKG